MMTTQAYYCTLCKVFSGDSLCAENHLKSQQHNEAHRVSSTSDVILVSEHYDDDDESGIAELL